MRKYTKQMMERKLEQIADEFLREEYGMGLDIPIKINGRLTRTLGRFKCGYTRSGQRVSVDIHISKKLIEHNSWEMVETILKHELIHYALFEIGLPFRDGDEYFENELKHHNVYSTGEVDSMMKKYVYKCKCREYMRTRKDGNNYRCNSCRGKLKFNRMIKPEKYVSIV